jgi:hypothetical protein
LLETTGGPGTSGAFFVCLCIGGHRTGGKLLR